MLSTIFAFQALLANWVNEKWLTEVKNIYLTYKKDDGKFHVDEKGNKGTLSLKLHIHHQSTVVDLDRVPCCPELSQILQHQDFASLKSTVVGTFLL